VCKVQSRICKLRCLDVSGEGPSPSAFDRGMSAPIRRPVEVPTAFARGRVDKAGRAVTMRRMGRDHQATEGRTGRRRCWLPYVDARRVTFSCPVVRISLECTTEQRKSPNYFDWNRLLSKLSAYYDRQIYR
jgi:hypothetical protein